MNTPYAACATLGAGGAGACRALLLSLACNTTQVPDAPPDVDLPGFYGYGAILPEMLYRRRHGAATASPKVGQRAGEMSEFSMYGFAGPGVGAPPPSSTSSKERKLDYDLLRWPLTMRTLIFTVDLGANLLLNSTVFYTLNSSARVPPTFALQQTLPYDSVLPHDTKVCELASRTQLHTHLSCMSS